MMKIEDNYLLYFILVILIVLMLIKMSKEHNDGFQNNKNTNSNSNSISNSNSNSNKEKKSNDKYTKFNETVFDKEDINEQITWKNKSLSQCKFECNEDNKCIGFSREKIGDNEKGNCFPKQKIGDCHSLRRGDPFQRDYAQGFDSYIKQSHKDSNLLTKCIGDAHTLNRKIYISSYIDPETFISIYNNDIRGIKYKDKNSEFQKNCIFEIIAGLEGSGTVSFIIVDNFQENYYLSANVETNTLELVPHDKDKSSVKERSLASFELFDGFADPTKVSIRTFSAVGEHYFWTFEGVHTKEIKAIKNPSIKLVKKSVLKDRIRKEASTFNISDKGIKLKEDFVNKPFIHHNNQDIFSRYNKLHNLDQSREPFDNTENLNNPINKLQDTIKKLPNKLKEKYFNKEDFRSSNTKTPKYSASTNAVILIDKEDNKLMIPSSISSISNIDLNNMVSKLNKIYTRDCPPSRFNVRDIENLKIDEIPIFLVDSDSSQQSNRNNTLIKDISKLNKIYKNSKNTGSLNTTDIKSILNKYKNAKDIQNKIIEQLSKIYTKNCNPRKFNINEINTVLITNPQEVSCRLFGYDYTIPGEFGDNNTIYEYENIINNTDMGMKEEIDYNMGELVHMAQTLGIDTSNKTKGLLYDDIIVKTAYNEGIELVSGRIYLDKPDKTYLNKLTTQINNKQEFSIDNNNFEKYIRNIIKTNMEDTEKVDAIRKYELSELFGKINQAKYFQIKSLQIFNHNPKDKFDKKTHKYDKIDYVSDKLLNLEKDHINDTTTESFGKFKKNKEIELEAYKTTVYEAERKLNEKRKRLEHDIEELGNTSSNYKLDKLSKDNFFMKKRLH
jgi:hypothetical protein